MTGSPPNMITPFLMMISGLMLSVTYQMNYHIPEFNEEGNYRDQSRGSAT